MKSKKRSLSILLACALCITLACAALAEGKLLTVWNAGTKLLFDTDNVTLIGHATFEYDGELFKVFDGRYVQQDVNSYMQVMLDTPQDGGMFSSGYTVFGEGGTAYSINSQQPKVYNTDSTIVAPSILTNTVMRSSMLRFGGLLLDLLEDRMQGAVTESATEKGTQYRVALTENQAPEALNAALTLMAQLAAREYLYIDVDQKFETGVFDVAYIDDWESLFALEYEKNFHEQLPADFYDQMWAENSKATMLSARYNMINDLLDMRITEADEAYDHGVALILADGTIKHYETQDAYIIDKGFEDVRYESYRSAFRAYYEKQTGKPLTDMEMDAIFSSSNEELIDRYIEMATDMENEYYAMTREGGYSSAIVKKNGTLVGYHDIQLMDLVSSVNSMTVTRRVLSTMTDLAVKNADVTIDLDAQGRIESVTGKVEFDVNDKFGEKHTLTVDFAGVAYDYGTSEAEKFDADAYGVVHAYEYYHTHSVNDVDDYEDEWVEPELPDTVVFDGVEYPIHPQNDNNG